MRHFGRMLTNGVRRVNGILALGAAWPGWPCTILVLATVGITLRLSDLILYGLSVQASIAAAVMDIRQREQSVEDEKRRKQDDKRDKMMAEAVDNTADLVVEMHGQNEAILELMRAAERRDKMAAKRDRAMLAALEARNDLLQFLRKEVQKYDRAAKEKSTRPPSRQRAQNGRANRLSP